MKAVVMEIHKDYCIVMTEDGQFLRQEIPAGRLEIGDEIVIEKEYYYERRASWVKSFAIAASVVVVVAVGSVFGVRYLKQYYPAGDIAMVAEEKAVAEEATREEVLMEEEALPTEEGTEEPALAMEAEQEETIIYKSKSVYSLEEGTTVREHIEDIIFSYKVSGERNLSVRLKNGSSTNVFNGTFTLIMLLSDGSVARTTTILLEGFEPGEIHEESFSLEAGEAEFRLEVTESIN
ncbi:hypothetical protein ES703_20354 [subsurface metagenome]